MPIQKVNFTSEQNINTEKIQTKPQIETKQLSKTDKEKSNAAKYMIGATALAAVIAIGVLSRKGPFREAVQKLIGGTNKKTSEAAAEAQEKINIETEKALKQIEEDKRLAQQAIELSNIRNEIWLDKQHLIKEKEYEKMWLNAEKEQKLALIKKHQKEVEEILNTNLKAKSEKELDEFDDMLQKRVDEMRSKGLNRLDVKQKQIDRMRLSPEEEEFMQLFEKMDSIRYERLDRESTFLEKILIKPGDKEVEVASATSYLNKIEQHALCEYYDLYPDNSALRSGVDPNTLPSVLILDNAFTKAPPLTKDAVVYRAVHGSPIFKDQNAFINSLKTGSIIKDASFVSTSTDATNAQFKQFARLAMSKDCGGVLMRIKLPKDTKGILGGYAEYLLPRNSQIKINKLEIINGQKVADCEYILP